MFICLFVCLFVCLFYLNHLGIPPGRFPEIFVKIRLDLAEIFMIKNLFFKNSKNGFLNWILDPF